MLGASETRLLLLSLNQALLKNLDDTSSTADVLECLAACPQLCSEDRRALAEEMSPITTPLRNWLLAREGGAPPLRGPRPSSPPPAHAPAGAPAKAAQRKGKGKGSNKGKGKGKGGGGGGTGAGATSAEATAGAAAPAAGASEEPEVEGEFFSQGRRGEGNRRSARESPELSAVVTHNLVVLLSALYRATPGVVADGGADGDDGGADASGRDKDGGDEGGGGGRGDDAASRLLAAAAAGGQLALEQDLVFGLAEPLLDACLQVAAKRASPQLFGTVVETKAMLRRRLWSSEDLSALDRQRKEVDVEFDAAVPSIKVCVCFCVWFDGYRQRLAADQY